MTDACEIAVDFMDMTNDRRRWARANDARTGLNVSAGRHVIVGGQDADTRVARIVAIDVDGNIELEVHTDNVEAHKNLLAKA